VEIRPDGTASAGHANIGIGDRPIAALLSSIACACDSRALAVVLTGMERDGSEGTRALKAAGATVLAQDEKTVEHRAMPRAAVKAPRSAWPCGGAGNVAHSEDVDKDGQGTPGVLHAHSTASRFTRRLREFDIS
jgi:CheB methylesterase